MRVLLDTNVLASAAATRGLCADVLREVLARHQLVLSRQVVGELRRVLCGKLGVPTVLAREFVTLIRRDAIHCDPKELPAIKLEDDDDLAILGAAIAAAADVLVTGDRELQELRQVSGVRIVSPRQFWEALASGPPGRHNAS